MALENISSPSVYSHAKLYNPTGKRILTHYVCINQKSSSALTFRDRQSLDKWDTGGAAWDLKG